MNSQQQVDKKRHGSKIMRSKSVNVTAISLIFFLFFAKFGSEYEAREKEKEREREKAARVEMERERGA